MGFLKSDKGENSLVIDISSGSTAAALVHTHEHDLPEILTRSRTPFFTTGEPSAGALQAAMISSLRSTLTSITSRVPALKEKGYGTSIDKVLVTFSSPWLATHLKTVIIAKEQGFVLDDHMLRTVIDEEKELFLSKLSDKYEEESEIVESTVTNLYLNGYSAKHPVKEKIKKAEVSFLFSATTKNLLRKVEDELIKTVGVKRGVALHSFMYVFFKVLSHSFQNLHSALVINMTQEITDTLFLRHGSSAMSASLPFGPSAIARAVAERLGIPETLAVSYLSLFASGAFDAKTTETLDAVLSDVENRWKALWKDMGESIPDSSSVPYSIFLIVPPGTEKLMKTFLEGIFGDKHVILLGETNTFTKELVKADASAFGDESLLVLSSFSNLLN